MTAPTSGPRAVAEAQRFEGVAHRDAAGRPGAGGLLEFQWEDDSFMGLRIRTYTCLTYEELVRRGEVKPGNKLPPLLPVAVYGGRPRWRSSTNVAELIAPLTESLTEHLPSFRYLGGLAADSRVASAAEAWQIPTRIWRG